MRVLSLKETSVQKHRHTVTHQVLLTNIKQNKGIFIVLVSVTVPPVLPAGQFLHDV